MNVKLKRRIENVLTDYHAYIVVSKDDFRAVDLADERDDLYEQIAIAIQSKEDLDKIFEMYNIYLGSKKSIDNVDELTEISKSKYLKELIDSLETTFEEWEFNEITDHGE